MNVTFRLSFQPEKNLFSQCSCCFSFPSSFTHHILSTIWISFLYSIVFRYFSVETWNWPTKKSTTTKTKISIIRTLLMCIFHTLSQGSLYIHINQGIKNCLYILFCYSSYSSSYLSFRTQRVSFLLLLLVLRECFLADFIHRNQIPSARYLFKTKRNKNIHTHTRITFITLFHINLYILQIYIQNTSEIEKKCCSGFEMKIRRRKKFWKLWEVKK